MDFTGVFHRNMKSILNVKETSNLINVIFSYNICSGIESQRAKKKPFVINSTKTFEFSQNYSVPFLRGTFDQSVSCLLLIDKQNEFWENSEKFERNPLFTTKKTFKKKIK